MSIKNPSIRKLIGVILLSYTAFVLLAGFTDETGIFKLLYIVWLWPIWLIFIIAGIKLLLPKKLDDAIESKLPKDRGKMKLYILAILVILLIIVELFDIKSFFFL